MYKLWKYNISIVYYFIYIYFELFKNKLRIISRFYKKKVIIIIIIIVIILNLHFIYLFSFFFLLLS